MSDLVVGVDVGTGSARAGVFDLAGKRLGSATRNIKTWTYNGGDFVEQSSEDIWRSCSEAVKEALGGIDKDRVVGISFDATCSLVVLNSIELCNTFLSLAQHLHVFKQIRQLSKTSSESTCFKHFQTKLVCVTTV